MTTLLSLYMAHGLVGNCEPYAFQTETCRISAPSVNLDLARALSMVERFPFVTVLICVLCDYYPCVPYKNPLVVTLK